MSFEHEADSQVEVEIIIFTHVSDEIKGGSWLKAAEKTQKKWKIKSAVGLCCVFIINSDETVNSPFLGFVQRDKSKQR